MQKRPSPEKELSSALQYLQLVIVEKGVATDELQATNQELGAILDGILNVRMALKVVVAVDGFRGVPKSNGRPQIDPKLLDLAQLEQQADEILKNIQAVIEQAMMLRMK